MTNYKGQVVELLNSIETGDSKPLAYINPDKYIQQNLSVGDGLTVFMLYFKLQRISQGQHGAGFSRWRFRICPC